MSNTTWKDEIEKTIFQSLVTSFGLDFLLFKDKDGGDVDTIHNARKGIYATAAEKEKYENRAAYDGTPYHSHKDYIARGAADKALQQEGKLFDAYRNKNFTPNEKRNLDHVISAKEIHHDPGRILAELNGVELANRESNFQTTHESVNKSKKARPTEQWLKEKPRLITQTENEIKKLQQEKLALDSSTEKTPANLDEIRRIEAEIRKKTIKKEALESVDEEAMRKADHKARTEYNQTINLTYYSSSKFLKQTGSAALSSGYKMGVRQVLGLVMFEVYSELREFISSNFSKIHQDFDFRKFVVDLKDSFHKIWQRIQTRFKDFLAEFKDGFFAGVMSNLTSTILNIFETIAKSSLKIIRDSWGHLVKAIKLLIFNPESLSFTDLCKALVGIVSTAASVVVGNMVTTELMPFCSFPFGAELATFAGALVTGLSTLGLTYFLLHSAAAQKVWQYIESLMPHAAAIKKYQSINAELDRYLLEFSRVEFNMNVDELSAFTSELHACNSEIERTLLLQNEVAKRNIDLPFKIGDAKSGRAWLASLAK